MYLRGNSPTRAPTFAPTVSPTQHRRSRSRWHHFCAEGSAYAGTETITDAIADAGTDSCAQEWLQNQGDTSADGVNADAIAAFHVVNRLFVSSTLVMQIA